MMQGTPTNFEYRLPGLLQILQEYAVIVQSNDFVDLFLGYALRTYELPESPLSIRLGECFLKV